MGKLYTVTLTGKELVIIEKLIMRHGNVVDFDMVYRVFGKEKNKQEVKNFIYKLVKKGWLIRIKRGVFVISDISGRGTIELSQLTIAQIIDNNSYISFEAALQHYGMFDQYLRVITSVGNKKTYSKKFNEWTYKYIKSKKNLFANHKEFNMDGRLVNIATKEKIIIDFLVYRRSAGTIDLIIEKLNNHKNEFDIQQIIELSKNTSITVMRTLGVIFDLANIESKELHELIKQNKNHSFATADSDSFNAKWRMYINKNLEKKK